MLLHFYKMNGAGNDFIIIDNRDLSVALDAATIEALCDRHRGIGADGLLAVEPARHGADYRFRYYNADGGEAEMCGNGARCFGRFAANLTDKMPPRVTFETIAGIITAEMVGDDVRIAMSEPVDIRPATDVTVPGLDATLHFINTGVPHVVAFVPGGAAFEELDVYAHGRAIRQHAAFAPTGTNATFGKVRNNILLGGLNKSRYGVYEDPTAGKTARVTALDNNDFWNAGLPRNDFAYRLWNGTSGTDLTFAQLAMLTTAAPAGNLNVDPLLDATWHLTATSPVIDKGTSTEAPSRDIDGDNRPKGTAVDIGADEAK